MQQTPSSAVIRNGQRASLFYLHAPFRSHRLVGLGFMLLADVSLLGAILVKNWTRLPVLSVFYLGIVLFGLLETFVGVLRNHKSVQHLIKTGHLEKLEAGSPLDTALCVAAKVTYLGLFHAFLLVGICLAALSELFIRY
jgi:hypothetical protein